MNRYPRTVLLPAILLLIFPGLTGAQWRLTQRTAGVPIVSLASVDGRLVASSGDSLYIVSDKGILEASSAPVHAGDAVRILSTDGDRLLLVSESTFCISPVRRLQWECHRITGGIHFTCAGISDSTIILGTDSGYFFFSTTRSSRPAVRIFTAGGEVHAITQRRGRWFAGTLGCGVYRSDNPESGWISINSGLTSRFIYSLASEGGILLAGSVNGSVFLRHAAGERWRRRDNGLPYTAIRSLLVCGRSVFAGTWGKGVFLEKWGDFQWREVSEGLTGDAANTVNALARTGSRLFAATGNGLWWRPAGEIISPIEEADDRIPAE